MHVVRVVSVTTTDGQNHIFQIILNLSKNQIYVKIISIKTTDLLHGGS